MAVGRVLGLLSLFLVVSVVAGALVAGLLVPGVAAAGGATRGSIDWFNSITTNLPDTRLQQTSQLLSSDGKVIARFSDENRTEAPLSARSARTCRTRSSRSRTPGSATTAGWTRSACCARSPATSSAAARRCRAASTLTQQYIKNLFLEQAVAKGDKKAQLQAVARDPKRKLLEVRAAIDLEKVLTKDQILERYLNIAYFGNGAYGVQAAAERYFSVSAAKLTIPQAALLAGMVQSPTLYDPLSTKARKRAALARRNAVLDRMHELGYMSGRRWKAFRAGKIALHPRTQQTGCIVATHSLAYFCEYVRAMIANGSDEFQSLGATQKDRLNALNRGGLKIYTTIDLNVQDAAVKAVTSHVPIGDKSKAASAAVTVEPGTGKVLAMAQNKKYSPKENDPSSTTINYSVDTRVQRLLRHPDGVDVQGVHAGGLSQGRQRAATTRWTRRSRTGRSPSSGPATAGPAPRSGTRSRTPRPTSGRGSASSTPPRSRSTPPSSPWRRRSRCATSRRPPGASASTSPRRSRACKQRQGHPDDQVPDCYPSLTLGPFSISPLTMAEAYATFAADGTYCPAWPLQKILGPDGKEQSLNKPKCNDNALPQDVAHGVTYALKRVLKPGGTAGHVWSGTKQHRRQDRDDGRVEGHLVRRIHAAAGDCGLGR